jgi:ring-1,2-phenylacetyl-CoA epoxidase subunit PaaB
VVPSTSHHRQRPGRQGQLFDPAADKIYRHPTFYDIPDEVGHM